MLAILIANSCESQRIIIITNGITYANTIAAGGVQAAALAHLYCVSCYGNDGPATNFHVCISTFLMFGITSTTVIPNITIL